MTDDSFVHLHVASGYSMRYGANSPRALVDRAAHWGQAMVALTDRDGLYGAVKFALAAREAGIRPIFGVDLARTAQPTAGSTAQPVGIRRSAAGRTGTGLTLADRTRATPTRASPARARTPARGGVTVDPHHPRVVLLARGAHGWAALCHVVSAAHQGLQQTGQQSGRQVGRGTPSITLDQIAEVIESTASGSLVALLGPDSDVGRALARRRPDLAAHILTAYLETLGRDNVYLEIVSHRARDAALAASDVDGNPARGSALSSAFSSALAARMLTFARDQRLPAVLTNAVRYVEPSDAPVVDVLDAVRRLVPLDPRHLDRPNAEGYLKSGPAMRQVAREIVALTDSSHPDRLVDRLLGMTSDLAGSVALDPIKDLGIGSVHVPELDVLRETLTTTRNGTTTNLNPAAAPATAAAPGSGDTGDGWLRGRCERALRTTYLPTRPKGDDRTARERLDQELSIISTLGFAGYFLTVADVVALIREMGVRVAARGSGAGSLVNYLLGISGVDPLEHGLVMERFLSPLRRALPDIDLDVESARRLEVYTAVFERFGDQRVTCVSMMDTYRVRHAIRDVGGALGMPKTEIDHFAKAFPHIRARDARNALVELPELRDSGLGRLAAQGRLDNFFSLVEALDGLPRHVAMHPCGLVLSDLTLLDRTPVEASAAGYPMSQFDKDDVEEMGLLKLDVLGIRMQSAMAHAVEEIARVDEVDVVVDDIALDDEPTFDLIRSTHTLGCFQIESPGQRELLGKFGPETFHDLIIDISLFRPGPVKSDMITPFLRSRQGWAAPAYLHENLRPVLAETYGVVVFHEQVLRMVAVMTGCSLAEADEVRRNLGSLDTQNEVRTWFYPAARDQGYDLDTIEEVWDVLRAFASFGFCKAHAAAFALPTYQSAWLKAHHPAAFLAGVLTHDPGMYPKRLILDDARNLGIAILGLDVNTSGATYRVERVSPYDEPPPEILGTPPRQSPPTPGVPDGRAYGIRLSLADVLGISEREVGRIVTGQPYASLTDFWSRATASRPVVERLVLAGGFDSIYGLGFSVGVRRRGQVTRRDLLLQVADLDRDSRASARATPTRSTRSTDGTAGTETPQEPDVQLSLGFDPGADSLTTSGLAEMSAADRVRAELEVLGLDVSNHVLDFYDSMLHSLGVVRSRDLLRTRSNAEILIAGVKVATQTPPVRSGRRVIFLTLDDSTGPVDATFFSDVQGPYAATVFGSWTMLVRGVLRRTGPRGVSLRATGAWDLGTVHKVWREALTGSSSAGRALEAVRTLIASTDIPTETEQAQHHRVLVHPSGYRQSPYADVGTPGEDVKRPPSKLWHASPGSSG
jgi:error-prone DNA polymerase